MLSRICITENLFVLVHMENIFGVNATCFIRDFFSLGALQVLLTAAGSSSAKERFFWFVS